METPQLTSIERISGNNRYLHLFESQYSNGMSWYTASRDVNYPEKIRTQGIANRPKGIHVIVFNQDYTKLLVTKEFRYTINNWVYAVPAGIIDPGESPVLAGLRELFEETGLSASSDNVFQVDPPYLSSTGLTDEIVTNVYIRLDSNVDCYNLSTSHLEPGELIESSFLSLEEIENLLAQGTAYTNGVLINAFNIMKLMANK